MSGKPSTFTVGGSLFKQQEHGLRMAQVLRNYKQLGGAEIMHTIARKWKHEARKLRRHVLKTAKQAGGDGDQPSSSSSHVLEDVVAHSGGRDMMDPLQQQAAVKFADELVQRERDSYGMTKHVVDQMNAIDKLLEEFMQNAGEADGKVLELTTKIAELEKKLAESDSVMSQTAAQVKQGNEATASAISSIAEMKDNIENLQAELAKAKEFEATAKKFEGRADITPEKLAELEKVMEAMKALEAKLAALEADHEALQAELRRRLGTIAEKDQEITGLEAHVNAAEAAGAANLSTTLKDKADLKHMQDEVAKSTGEIEILKQQLLKATSEHDLVKADRDDLAAQLAQHGIAKDGEVSKISQDLKDKIAEFTAAQAELLASKALVESSHAELAAEKQKYAELEKLFAELQQKLAAEIANHGQTNGNSADMNKAFVQVMTKLESLKTSFRDRADYSALEKGAEDRLHTVQRLAITASKYLQSNEINMQYLHVMQLQTNWVKSNIIQDIVKNYQTDPLVVQGLQLMEQNHKQVIKFFKDNTTANLKELINSTCPASTAGDSVNFFCNLTKLIVIDVMVSAAIANPAMYKDIITIIAELKI